MTLSFKKNKLPDSELILFKPIFDDGRFLNSFPILVGDAQRLQAIPRADKSDVSNKNQQEGTTQILQVEKSSFLYPYTRNDLLYSTSNIDKTKKTVLYSCNVCHKGFSSKLGRDNHVKQKHGSRDQCFSCHICGKMFPTLNMLSIHQRVHSDYRPFECAECGKGYKHKKDLKTHRCGQSRVPKWKT